MQCAKTVCRKFHADSPLNHFSPRSDQARPAKEPGAGRRRPSGSPGRPCRCGLRGHRAPEGSLHGDGPLAVRQRPNQSLPPIVREHGTDISRNYFKGHQSLARRATAPWPCLNLGTRKRDSRPVLSATPSSTVSFPRVLPAAPRGSEPCITPRGAELKHPGPVPNAAPSDGRPSCPEGVARSPPVPSRPLPSRASVSACCSTGQPPNERNCRHQARRGEARPENHRSAHGQQQETTVPRSWPAGRRLTPRCFQWNSFRDPSANPTSSVM